jgi:hypothetical protein
MKLLTRGRLVAVVGIMALGVVLVARGTNNEHPARVSVPYDWSHRHVVFSQPASLAQARRLQQEPRYWHQMLRRNAVSVVGVDARARGFDPPEPRRFPRPKRVPATPLARDWAVSLGPGASTGNATFPQFPAKFTYDVSQASITCSDFVAFPTNVPGQNGVSGTSTGQPSIIGYENLYSEPGGTGACPTTGPTIAWAYNTGAGLVSGSPVVSGDGTKIAFVESNSGGSILHLLQFIEFDGVDPITGGLLVIPPTNLPPGGSAWSACPPAQSCMISFTFSAATAANSSPFYDFATDELYLGDDSGVLYKFASVFSGTPAEVTTGWPITVHAGAALTPAVFDSVTNNLFVADSLGVLSFVKDTGSTLGACATGVAPCLGSTTVLATSGSGFPIIDPPSLDPTTGKVFAFVGDSGSMAVTGVAQGSYVVQANADLTGVVRLNQGRNGAPLHSGAFDNTYLNSSPGSIAGHMWICGKGASDIPTLRRIAFLADGTITTGGAAVRTVGSVIGAAGQCSPVTEFFNPTIGPGTDLIFFSVQSGDLAHIGLAPGNTTNCPGTGCVMSADVTSGVVPAHILSSAPELGGTSGIIIDNFGTDAQESNIYFTRLAQTVLSSCGGSGASMVGCAVKLTQALFN